MLLPKNGIYMIFTKIKLKNWYSFKDATLDLTYPKKISNNSINYEYLKKFEKIRFKRVQIISGANSSGKTSFSKAVSAIRDFLALNHISPYIQEGIRSENEKIGFEVEFISEKIRSVRDLEDNNGSKPVVVTSSDYDHFSLLEVSFEDPSPRSKKSFRNFGYTYKYFSVPIQTSDTTTSLRRKIESLKEGKALKNSIYLSNIPNISTEETNLNNLLEYHYFPSAIGYLCSDLNHPLIDSKTEMDLKKNVLYKVLKTFDPSISGISDSIHEDSKEHKGFYVDFYNKKSLYISKSGDIADNKHLLSLGTHQAVNLAKFLSSVIDFSSSHNDASFMYFLDENMANVQSEIEKSMINLVIEKMGDSSQFFYNTHNYEVLEMNLPIHSFVFIKRDDENNSSFIQAEHKFNKNDRTILSYVKNDVLGTLPDTHLIDDLLYDDEEDL